VGEPDWFPSATLKIARRDGRHVQLLLTPEATDDYGSDELLLIDGYPVGSWDEDERGWWVLSNDTEFGDGETFHASSGRHLIDDDIAGWRNLQPLNGAP
jgi:hypothetical protein